MSNNFIWGDFINEKVVDEVVDFYNNQDMLKYKEGITGKRKVNKEFKDSIDLTIPIRIYSKFLKRYGNELQRILNLYLCKFPYAIDGTSPFRLLEDVNIQKYGVGGGFKVWHCERQDSSPDNVYRHLVFMTYLNDVPDGGTEWYHQDLYIPAKKGYTVIWPADWTHLHRGRVSHTKEKMIITGWYSFV
tara:strand:- start:659 stop:1222 length:564 start_codon:yes stop_codon:yes gene_type:complete